MTTLTDERVSIDDATPEEWSLAFKNMRADSYQVGGDHYFSMAMPPWDVMEMVLTPDEFRGFLKGNIIKYSLRQGRKEGSDDAKKAKHYAAKLKEMFE